MTPTVGVVVVNYNGGELTLECLRSLLRTRWPAQDLRLVLVDNASSDGVTAKVRAELPVVKVIESPVNGGFGAGCNLGIRSLAEASAIALVNNDATVAEDWLAPLARALDQDDQIGAACPKILFAGRFAGITLRSETYRRGRGDRRELGVKVAGARVDGRDVWPRTQFCDGFWGTESDPDDLLPQWSSAVAHLRVPVAGDVPAPHAELLLSADVPTRVRLHSGPEDVEHTADRVPRWVALPLGDTPIDVVNNAGTVLTDDGYGADRGFLEPDDGRYDEECDVFAWCGGAVLLRRSYLDDVGPFDERLFVYYEDLDLSWRGEELGWRYRYVPTSVVRHVHAATSVQGSALKRFYDERNHLVVMARHAGLPAVTRAAARSLLVTASYARRDLVAPVLARRPADTSVVRNRLAAFGGFVRLLPATLRDRRR